MIVTIRQKEMLIGNVVNDECKVIEKRDGEVK